MGISQLIKCQMEMFLLMAVGMFCRRKNIITHEGKKTLTDLIMFLILPATIIKSFMISFNGEILRKFAQILIVSVLIQIFCSFARKLLFGREQEGRREVMQYGLIVSNGAYLGNPVAQAMFGSEGLAYASIYLIPMRIAMWSEGLALFHRSGSKKEMAKKVLTHPCILSVFIGVFLMAARIRLPGVLEETIQSLAGCNTALSMMLVGTILGEAKPSQLKKIQKDSLKFCAVRLLLMPGLVYIGCTLAHTAAIVRGVAVILTAMPAAAATAILASKYEKDAEFASKIVVVSTIFSLVTTPLWGLLLI